MQNFLHPSPCLLTGGTPPKAADLLFIFLIPRSRPRTLQSRSGSNNARLRYTCAQSGHYNAQGVEPPPALRRTMKNFF